MDPNNQERYSINVDDPNIEFSIVSAVMALELLVPQFKAKAKAEDDYFMKDQYEVEVKEMESVLETLKWYKNKIDEKNN